MSQVKITLPITVEYLEKPGELVPARDLSASNPEDQVYRFKPKPNRQLDGPFDPWDIREQFLSWPLEHWDLFVDAFGDLGGFGMTENLFAEWQRLLFDALVRPAAEWPLLAEKYGSQKVGKLLRSLPLSYDWSGSVPIARIQTARTIDAIIATIQVDKLQGAEFRVCARADCKNPPFKVGTRQKIYCDMACAHLVAVRNSRTRTAGSKASKKSKLSEKRRGK